MTREEFLIDTINYYSQDPNKRRCSIEGSTVCVYSPENANKPESEGCAIGRQLSTEAKLAYDRYSVGVIDNIFKYTELKQMAPLWMQSMDVMFLKAVQRLHDVSTNWNEEGLTSEGRDMLMSIIRNHHLDEEVLKDLVDLYNYEG